MAAVPSGKRLDINTLCKIGFVFLFLCLLPYQNCSQGPANTLTSNSTGCPSGKTSVNGQCIKSAASALTITISSPSGGQALPIASNLVVSGQCLASSNPIIQIYLNNLAGVLIQQAVTNCQAGGTGTYSAILATTSGQIVPDVGLYTIVVYAQAGAGSSTTKLSVNFTGGQASPILLNGSSASIERAITPTSATTPLLNLAATCDTANTKSVELHRKGLGKISVPTDFKVDDNICSSYFSLTDQFVPWDSTNVRYSFGNYSYYLIGTDVNKATLNSPNTVNVYVRPLPKDINNDDLYWIANTIANILSAANIVGLPSLSDPALFNSQAQPFTINLLNSFGPLSYPYSTNTTTVTLSSVGFGVFQEACILYEQATSKFGTEATNAVCQAFSNYGCTGSDPGSFNASTSAPFWSAVQSYAQASTNAIGTSYLLPQSTASGSITQIPGTACP